MRILVVEDDPLVRELIVEALRDEQLFVIHAGTGEEATAWCRRGVVDVLVTDVTLPGDIDGWRIAECCREHDPELPVIYVSGYSAVTSRPVSNSIFLQKPYHPGDVVRAVMRMGRGRRPASPEPGGREAE